VLIYLTPYYRLPVSQIYRVRGEIKGSFVFITHFHTSRPQRVYATARYRSPPGLGSTKDKEEKYKTSTLTRNSEKNRIILYLPVLKPNVTADGRSYFHLKCPSLRQSGKAFSLLSTNLRLTEEELPVWPIEVKETEKKLDPNHR